jgi:predicted dehydrogenase
MYRIGLIGSESSHAAAFSRLANLPDDSGAYRFPDVRITHICGETVSSAQTVAEHCQIPNIAKDITELYHNVDAVMVLHRHGGMHYQAAIPFLKMGIPVWIDKPFTMDPEECFRLIDTARTHSTLLAGGSTCKYCPDVLHLQKEFQRLNRESKVISGAFNFPGELDSPYGGIYFYGGHAAEILTTIFGDQIRSIKADVHCNNLIALVKYDTFTVTINFSEVSQFYGTIYSPSEVVQAPIDISSVYYYGFSKFIEALQQNRLLESYESLARPVLFLNALEKAIQTGEVFLSYAV